MLILLVVKMYLWFFISVLGEILVLPLYFLSLEHTKLQRRYGKKKGNKIGQIFGLISGWGFFLFWIGIWISPQPRFAIPLFQNLSIPVPFVNFSIPLLHLTICLPFLALGAWLGIEGTKETSLKVAETHRSEKIVTTGVYSIVRHPQYVGGLLAHVGISFLLSAWYSLLATPLMFAIIYLISRKEEEELIKEFGKEYEKYKKKVPMLLAKIRS
jgi:protein-S-isoprenylcysteine O-methyltransferase Ste14